MTPRFDSAGRSGTGKEAIMNMPFPGMDPYLEHPSLWPGIHNRLIVAVANQLQPRLMPRYLASIEERVYVESTHLDVIPDVQIRQLHPTPGPAPSPSPAADTPVVVAVQGTEVHEAYLQILDRYDDLRVVTVVEVISPTNKSNRNGRRSYRAKQRETLAAQQHLVEIDLLRRGRHVLAVPLERTRESGAYSYLVSVNRWPARNEYELYPRQLRDRLPRIRVPLVAPDPDVTLDIQAALEQVYMDGAFFLRLRNQEPCVPSLPVADQTWAHQCWAAFQAARPDLFGNPSP
jgi:hypothetical protein